VENYAQNIKLFLEELPFSSEYGTLLTAACTVSARRHTVNSLHGTLAYERMITACNATQRDRRHQSAEPEACRLRTEHARNSTATDVRTNVRAGIAQPGGQINRPDLTRQRHNQYGPSTGRPTDRPTERTTNAAANAVAKAACIITGAARAPTDCPRVIPSSLVVNRATSRRMRHPTL